MQWNRSNIIKFFWIDTLGQIWNGQSMCFSVKVFSRQTILFSLFRTIAFAFVILRVIIWKLCLHFLFIGIVFIVSFVELKTIGANKSFFQKVYHLTWFIIGWTVNVKRCKAFSNTFKLCSFYFYYFCHFSLYSTSTSPHAHCTSVFGYVHLVHFPNTFLLHFGLIFNREINYPKYFKHFILYLFATIFA